MKTKITDYILRGEKSKRTRRQLMNLTDLSDRQIRNKIMLSRMDGNLICSTSHSIGYYVAEDADDPAIGVFIRETMSRIKKEFAIIKPFIDSQKVVDGQISFSEYKDYMKLGRILSK